MLLFIILRLLIYARLWSDIKRIELNYYFKNISSQQHSGVIRDEILNAGIVLQVQLSWSELELLARDLMTSVLSALVYTVLMVGELVINSVPLRS